MAKVYLGLGTNLGDKEQNLRDAVQKIEEQVGKIVSLSAFYVTAPWGFSSDNSFLNAAVCVETKLSPLEVLQETQMIEKELGRTQKSVNRMYSDRLIDIDLLLYEDLVLSVISASGVELTLPHPVDDRTRLRYETTSGNCSRISSSGTRKNDERAYFFFFSAINTGK